jgi:hypothetical protein
VYLVPVLRLQRSSTWSHINLFFSLALSLDMLWNVSQGIDHLRWVPFFSIIRSDILGWYS